MSDSESRPFMSLGDFLSEYYPHFAIMGIFGTVSVFLSQNFPGGSERLAARGGIVASLVIFSLTSVWLCWKALSELFKEINSGERPLGTEFGYTVIVLCTATLAYSISSAILAYSAVIDLALTIVVPTAGFVAYIRYYPLDRYRKFEVDDPTGFALVVAAAVFMGLHPIISGIRYIYAEIAVSGHIDDALLVLLLMGYHQTASEVNLALRDVAQRWHNTSRGFLYSIKQVFSFLRNTPDFHLSVLLSSAAMVLLYLVGFAVSGIKSPEPRYFFVASHYWLELYVYQLSAFLAFVTYCVQTRREHENKINTIGRYMTFTVFATVAIECLYLIIA